jgi:hypothetical protein
MALFKIPFQNLPGETEESDGKYQTSEPVSRPRLDQLNKNVECYRYIYPLFRGFTPVPVVECCRCVLK